MGKLINKVLGKKDSKKPVRLDTTEAKTIVGGAKEKLDKNK